MRAQRIDLLASEPGRLLGRQRCQLLCVQGAQDLRAQAADRRGLECAYRRRAQGIELSRTELLGLRRRDRLRRLHLAKGLLLRCTQVRPQGRDLLGAQTAQHRSRQGLHLRRCQRAQLRRAQGGQLLGTQGRHLRRI